MDSVVLVLLQAFEYSPHECKVRYARTVSVCCRCSDLLISRFEIRSDLLDLGAGSFRSEWLWPSLISHMRSVHRCLLILNYS